MFPTSSLNSIKTHTSTFCRISFMASHLQPLFILFLLLTINNHILSAQSTPRFLLKLTKDLETHQYTTQLLVGIPQLPTKLLLHLSGQSLWLNCPPSSPSRNFVTRNSLQCLMAKSTGQKVTKSPTTTTCHIHQQNPITGESNFGDLSEDIVAVDGATVDRFLFSCSTDYLLKGLVKGAKGVLGFGRSKVAFQSQMVNNFDFSRKFTLCLSSSDGFIISGTGTGADIISNSLSYSYTPLTLTSNHGYYVNVNSIKINGRRLVAGNPIGDVEISSTVPYTIMKTTLYETFKKACVGAMNMSVVAPVAPFGLCFSSPATVVPEIELVFQSELVRWRIQGFVHVSDSVTCLGFVDGGSGLGPGSSSGSMILGGHQLEDHLLEFDLGRGMMGLSSNLLKEGDSCSNIRTSVSDSVLVSESL